MRVTRHKDEQLCVSSMGGARAGSAYIRKGDRKWNRYCLLLTMIGAGVYIRESETVRDKYSTPNGEVEGGGVERRTRR